MLRHILIKLSKLKYKEKILKSAREKQQITYKGNPITLTSDLSAETLQTRRTWQDIFKVMKGKNPQPRLLYTARISFTFNGEMKTFRQATVKRIQHHQISFTKNTKGASPGRKHKRWKRPTKTNPKQLRKW